MNKFHIKNIYKFILDIIFPINCLSCCQEGDWICPNCLLNIKVEDSQACPRCHKPSPGCAFCHDCEITSKMKGIIIASSYENKLLRKAVRFFKYHNIKDLRHPLGKILSDRLKILNTNNLSELIFIPVPLHKKKQRTRGYNQAELLAEAASVNLGVKIEKDILRRVKNTLPQAKLSPIKRRKNIKNAFSLNPKTPTAHLPGKKIFLIDDVCTTSSTLEECAKEIAKLGPKEIWGLVLARGR